MSVARSPRSAASLVSPLRLQRAKELVRLFASRCCQVVLQATSRPYVAQPGPTIVFAPHQDDETLGCGALIARKRSDGLPVHVVFLTDGAASHPRHPLVTPGEITAVRLQEARRVLATLGVDSSAIYFFNQPDGTLDRLGVDQREALVARLTVLIERIEPAEIFVPCNTDGSSEHEAAFGFVVAAIARARTAATLWEYPVWLWWNPLTMLSRVVLATSRCRAPTEDFLPIKRRALAHYRSQLEPLPPQTEPALPSDLLRLFDPDAEYFFHFAPPAAIAWARTRPVI